MTQPRRRRAVKVEQAYVICKQVVGRQRTLASLEREREWLPALSEASPQRVALHPAAEGRVTADVRHRERERIAPDPGDVQLEPGEALLGNVDRGRERILRRDLHDDPDGRT